MTDLSFDGPNIETFVVGDNVPTSVFAKEKPWYVQVKWQTIGSDWANLTGSWDLGVFLESLEPSSSSLKLPDRHLIIPLNPEPNPVNYGPVNFEFEAHSLDAGVYKITIFLTLIDLNGNPTPMVGFAEKAIAIIELNKPNIVEQAISTAIGVATKEQEISTGVKVTEGGKKIVVAPEGIEVGKSSEGQRVVIPYEKTFDIMGEHTKFAKDQLKPIYDQHREQNNRWFQVSIAFAVVGILVIIIGIITLIRGDISISVVTTISSVLTEAIALLSFAQYRKTSKEVEKDTKILGNIGDMAMLVDIADSMNDPKFQDKLKAEIVRKKLKLVGPTEKTSE